MKFLISVFQDEDGMFIAECPSLEAIEKKFRYLDNIPRAFEKHEGASTKSIDGKLF